MHAQAGPTPCTPFPGPGAPLWLQSGDNDILRAMLRGYTAERYQAIIDNIRRYMPDASISGDAIVGFPGAWLGRGAGGSCPCAPATACLRKGEGRKAVGCCSVCTLCCLHHGVHMYTVCALSASPALGMVGRAVMINPNFTVV